MTSEVKLSWLEANRTKPNKLLKYERYYRKRKYRVLSMLHTAVAFNITLDDYALYAIFEKSVFYETQMKKLHYYHSHITGHYKTNWPDLKEYFECNDLNLKKDVEWHIYQFKKYKYIF